MRLFPIKCQDEQETALQTITSLPDQLNVAHTSVKKLLGNLPAYLQNIEELKHSIPANTETIHGYEEDLKKKEAEPKTVENRYNELIQMTPEAQRRELREVKDKAMLTMQQDQDKVRLKRDRTTIKMETKNKKIAELEEALGRRRELVPELIADLTKLAPKIA